MANIIGIVALCVGILALVFSILACALPHWVVNDDANLNGGLWDVCVEVLGTETCQDPLDATNDDDMKSDIKAVRAMVLLGLLCIAGAIVPIVLLLFIMKDNKIMGFIGGGIFILGGLFLMIGMAIYVDKIYDDDVSGTELGAGFAMDILGWIFAWIAGGLSIFAAIKGDGSIGSS